VDASSAVAPSSAPNQTVAPATQEPAKKSVPAEWMVVPIPSYNPTLGFILTGVGAYIFPVDPGSPPSVVAGGGFYSGNNSWAAFAGGKFNLAEDRYRVSTGVFVGQINYDFYGIGTDAGESGKFVPLQQRVSGGLLQALFRIAPHLYLGPRYTLARIRSSVDLSQTGVPPEIVPPQTELSSWVSAPGVVFQWDTRDSEFYPRKGQLLDVKLDFHVTWLGDAYSYLAAKIAWNQYLGLGTQQVLAFRELVSFVTDGAPFYALPRLGQGMDIRGYKTGQYQDNILLAAQVEYRLKILAWLGAVAFVGVGEVMPDLGAFSFSNLLPAGGLGVRLTLAKANQVNFRADVAFSKDGTTFYLGIGEAY
jgi:outer membrane protein assembly factor BamA